METMSQFNVAKELIQEIGGNSLIVGGAVRDFLMGIDPKDVDIATDVPVFDIEQRFDAYDIGKSKDFGIVTVNFKDHSFEVANFRKDGEYTDFRRPDSVQISQSFNDDASRRDFTINAIGIDANGCIIDPFNGQGDISNRLIKCVGDAVSRFTEDPVRILRMARFAARFDFNIDKETFDASIQCVDLISKVAMERIKLEFWKSACNGVVFERFLRTLEKIGMLNILMPEIMALKGKQQAVIHHPEGCALCHTYSAIKVSISNDPLVNFSILMHDIGKAPAYKFEDGKHKFHGHEKIGIPIADSVCKRFKLSDFERKAVLFCVEHHMNAHRIDQLKNKKILSIVNSPFWCTLKMVMYADEMSRLHASRGPEQFWNKVNAAESIVANLNQSSSATSRLNELANGYKIMMMTNAKGKEVGRIKDAIHEFILDKNFNVSQEEIDKKICEIA